MSLKILQRNGWEELVLTLRPEADETPEGILMRAISLLHRENAELLRAVVFGRVAHNAEPPRRPRGVPVTFVEGAPCNADAVAGAQVTGARGGRLTFYEAGNGGMVSVVEDGHARWAWITGIEPTQLWAPPHIQAREAFERAEAALRLAAMDFRHVYRTWLFLDNILGWYGELNRVRTEFYRERGVLQGLVPASTGIGASNPSHSALVLDLLAVAPSDDSVSVVALPSPLQCPALDYGSSFSRAVEVREPGLRRIFVSGTASIGADGRTRHVDDILAQTEYTIEVVEAILNSRGMDWGHANRGLVYVRDAGDAAEVASCLARRGVPSELIVTTQSIVCRQDLLFEIEVDAAASSDLGQP